jgi:hypothetical protein
MLIALSDCKALGRKSALQQFAHRSSTTWHAPREAPCVECLHFLAGQHDLQALAAR